MAYMNKCKLGITEGKTIPNQVATRIPQSAANPGLFLCQTAEMNVQ